MRLLVLSALLLWLGAAPLAQSPDPHVWLDADGNPLPFQSHPEIADFLKTAEVVSRRAVGVGTADVARLLLEKDGVRAHAAFRHIDVARRNLKLGAQRIPYFRDDCKFEVAAYFLSERLGIHQVPPTVVRRVNGVTGSVQMWVEKAMMEKDRVEQRIESPPPARRMLLFQTMYLFDNLIHNDDRNQGNILYDPEGHLWMIDHTRAFRLFKQPSHLDLIRMCRKDVLQRLRQLKEQDLRTHLKGVLTRGEIRAVLARRDVIVEHLMERIELFGERSVLF